MAEAKHSAKKPDEATVPHLVTPLTEPQNGRFPIVGIGASAGGLAAFEAFFSTMPADNDPGLALKVEGLGHLAGVAFLLICLVSGLLIKVFG